MENRKPNHICRNCGKQYWACNDCDKMHSWRAMACSPECYQKYIDAVLVARSRSSGENEVQSKTNESVIVPSSVNTDDNTVQVEKEQRKKWK